MTRRTSHGQFAKGSSGNPGGRPLIVGEVIELARKQTAAAINVLTSIMEDTTAHAHARVTAANSLLDRGYGKALQHITGEGPIIARIERVIIDNVQSVERESDDTREHAGTGEAVEADGVSEHNGKPKLVR